MKPVSRDHKLYRLFTEMVGDSLSNRGAACPEVESYLTDLLVRFIHTDCVYAIKREGKPLRSVIEMVAEGDVRLNADSFEREREVHRHIGDYIMFWSGVHPDYLSRMRLAGLDLRCDYTEQGMQSYHLVSTFEHPPFGEEAPTFRRLSEGFAEYASALAQVASKLSFYAA